MENNIHDEVFVCPKCFNKSLIPVGGSNGLMGIGYHELCVCEECATELYSEPQYDFSVKFVELESEI